MPLLFGRRFFSRLDAPWLGAGCFRRLGPLEGGFGELRVVEPTGEKRDLQRGEAEVRLARDGQLFAIDGGVGDRVAELRVKRGDEVDALGLVDQLLASVG